MANIGIDLGTSNSAAAVLRGGRSVIIPSAEAFPGDGQRSATRNACAIAGLDVAQLVNEPIAAAA